MPAVIEDGGLVFIKDDVPVGVEVDALFVDKKVVVVDEEGVVVDEDASSAVEVGA